MATELASSETYQRICERLRNENVQAALARVFTRYVDDLQEVLVVATSGNAGVRPANLTNEVYSCFHHLARGLSAEDVDPEEQFHSARDSHLKRAILDSYKLALHFVLSEDERMREVLDYLVLAKDFTRFIPDGLQRVNEIKDTARSVRDFYCQAMHAERQGKFEDAMARYNTALERAGDLQQQISVFTRDKTYLLACAREVQEAKDKRKDRWNVIIAAVISAVLTAALAVGAPALLKKSKPSGDETVPKTQPESGGPVSPSHGPAISPDNITGRFRGK